LRFGSKSPNYLKAIIKPNSGSMNHPTLKATPHSRSSRLPGFTLVEILTVIAIITILMAAGVIGIGNINAGKGVTSAVATCESLFEEARTIAVSKRCKTRVLIAENLTSADPSENLRKVTIIHEEIDSSTGMPKTPVSWVVASRSYIMPNGVFFSKRFSKPEAVGPDRVMGLPGVQTPFQGSHVFYEFNAEGLATVPGASFILGSGIRPRNQGDPLTTRGASRDFSGFVVWRNGRTSMFRSPDQISPDISKFEDTGENF
jgi:prepilin-type N-terminal cleavage/methylation domain-containing protein